MSRRNPFMSSLRSAREGSIELSSVFEGDKKTTDIPVDDMLNKHTSYKSNSLHWMSASISLTHSKMSKMTHSNDDIWEDEDSDDSDSNEEFRDEEGEWGETEKEEELQTVTENETENETETEIEDNNKEEEEEEEKENRRKKTNRYTPEKNFFADSPYYNASVTREVNYAKIVADTINAIIKDTSTFVKAGRQMVRATKRLSNSCKLDAGSNIISPEGFQVKQHAMGEDLCELLFNLGNVLDKIGEVQEKMCDSFETVLNSDLGMETKEEYKNARSQRSDTFKETESAEIAFSNYLNINEMSTSSHRGGIMTSYKGTSKKTSRRTSSFFREPDHNIVAPEMELKDTLHQLRASQIHSEISRFNLMKNFLDKKHHTRYTLCSKFSFLIEDTQKILVNCNTAITKFLPVWVEASEKMIKESSSRHIVVEKKENAIRSMLLLSNTDDLSKSKEDDDDDIINPALLTESNADSSAGASYNKESIEHSIEFWDLPVTLAKAWRHRRFGTSGVQIEGWLYHKKHSLLSGHTWVRDWYMVDDGALNKLCPKEDRTMFLVEKVFDVVLTTLREIDGSAATNDRFCFEIQSSCSNKPMVFKAKGPHELERWVNGYRAVIGSQLSLDHGNDHLNECIGQSRISANVTKAVRQASISNLFAASVADAALSIENNILSQNPVVQEMMEKNPTCAECNGANPTWCSLNLGILVCINCSGIHRSMGVHVSKVRSLEMDSLSDSEAGIFLSLGNKIANSIWEGEYNIKSSSIKRPMPDADLTERKKWITSKYVEKIFLFTKKKQNKCEEDTIMEDDPIIVSSSSSEKLAIQQQRNKDLYQEAKKGNIQKVASLVAHGADINWKNDEDDGATPLEACLMMSATRTPDEEDDQLYSICSEYLKLNSDNETSKHDIKKKKKKQQFQMSRINNSELGD